MAVEAICYGHESGLEADEATCNGHSSGFEAV